MNEKSNFKCSCSFSSVSPKFYCFNLVYLGKCHLRMGNKDKAKAALQQALDMENKNSDDDEVSDP